MTKHEHLKLDQSKIDRAKRLLGAKTEKETIERALDLVLGEEPILKAHRLPSPQSRWRGPRGAGTGPTERSTNR